MPAEYEAEESSQEFMIDNKNYAADADKAADALDFLKKVFSELEMYRSSLNSKYLEYYNIYRTVHDIRFYNGEAQVYIPVLRKAAEQFVSRVKRALFPTDDVFDVEPLDQDTDDESDVIYDYMKWQIEKRVKLKQKIDRFLRQLAMFGWAVVECGWEEDIKKIVGLRKKRVPAKEKRVDPITGNEYYEETGEIDIVIEEAVKEIVKKRNPTFDVQDNFATYLWPHTANDMDEVHGVITLSKQTKNWLLSQKKKGVYVNIESSEMSSGDLDDQWNWSMEARLATDGLTNANELDKTFPRVTLVKYHGLYNWGTEEEPDEHETVITTISSRICIELRKCQYFDNEKPYVLGRINELMNEIYSSGLYEPLAKLQYYLNDTANQTFDSNYYSLNPIVKYDPGRVVNIASIAFAPGAMWALTDPSAADIIRPPEVASIGFSIMAQVKGLIEEYSGLQNIPMTGRKAALHIQALQQEYSLPVQQIVENLEDTIMSPWLKKAYSRVQQFLNKKDVVRVTGRKGLKYWRTIDPTNLAGDYNFYWRGANQTTNIHIKSQQIAQFLNTMSPWVQLMMQQQKLPNIEWLLKEYWSDGLAMDGEDKLFISMQDERALPPEIENMIMALGKPLPTSMGDDHQGHMQAHQPLLQSAMPEIVEIARMHMEKHQKDFENMQKLMQQQAAAPPPEPPAEPGQEVEGERMMEGNQPIGNFRG